MSVAPIKVGETDKTLQGVAYVVSGGLITGVKTDLVVADIDSLYVIRDQSTAVTISSDGSGLTNKTNQNDAHSDGAVWNPGDGTLFVDIPDAAVAVYAKDVQLKGSWTDGGDSGVIRGTPVALTSGFDWSTFGATILNRIGAFTGSGVNTILGFFKAIMFSDATEPSDAGDTFAASLEEVKSTAGSVTVTPLQISQDQRGAPQNIELKYKEVRSIGPLAITDSNNNPVDLSSKTLRIIIERRDGTDLQVVEAGSITVSGASNNQISFTNSIAVTNTVDSPKWALWDVTNEDTDAGIEGEWLQGGLVHVVREPTNGAA